MSIGPSASTEPHGMSGWRKSTIAGASARWSARWRLASRVRRHERAWASSRNSVGSGSDAS